MNNAVVKGLAGLLLTASCCAQNPIYNLLDIGPYNVKFTDTVLYDHQMEYKQYGYSGLAPIFVNIWYPDTKRYSSRRINFGEIRNNSIPGELQNVYQELSGKNDEIFIRDGILYNQASGEDIDYHDITPWEVLDLIKNSKTITSRKKLSEVLHYPVIIYHHGNQGSSIENSVMAEFFASHGYIFISANFHLPYEKTIYGLLPYHLEKKNPHNQSSVKTVINFGKSISSSNKLFYIGHSWGAQEGWCFLYDSKWADGFISLETTLEFKKDLKQIKEIWPYVYKSIVTEQHKFSIPILSFAALEPSTNFDFFGGINSNQTLFASYKKPFGHNSYTSSFLARYSLVTLKNKPDFKVLASQVEGYVKHLNLILEFLNSLNGKTNFSVKKFTEDFQFTDDIPLKK